MEKPTLVKGWVFLYFGRVMEGLFFLLLQRGAQDVAKARTGIG